MSATIAAALRFTARLAMGAADLIDPPKTRKPRTKPGREQHPAENDLTSALSYLGAPRRQARAAALKAIAGRPAGAPFNELLTAAVRELKPQAAL